jgi:hypothetical protein
MMKETDSKQLPREEPPPTGGSWATLYAVVLCTLAALVVAFYIFTRAFR